MGGKLVRQFLYKIKHSLVSWVHAYSKKQFCGGESPNPTVFATMGQSNLLRISLFSIVTFVVINLNTLGSEGNQVRYTPRESKALEDVTNSLKI